jgi:hypothetical protein
LKSSLALHFDILSELQTRIQSYKLGLGWSIQKCRRKQNKTRVTEPVLFLIKYRTDVDLTKIVTRMLLRLRFSDHIVQRGSTDPGKKEKTDFFCSTRPEWLKTGGIKINKPLFSKLWFSPSHVSSSNENSR